MDFDNPLYREMSGLDLPQNPNDIIFLPDSNTVRFLIETRKNSGDTITTTKCCCSSLCFLARVISGYLLYPVHQISVSLYLWSSPLYNQSSKKSFIFLSSSMFCCLKNKLRKIFGKISVISNLKKLAPKKYKNHRSTRNENSREGLYGERHKFGGRFYLVFLFISLSVFLFFFVIFAGFIWYGCQKFFQPTLRWEKDCKGKRMK